jgi:hypothetical protein
VSSEDIMPCLCARRICSSPIHPSGSSRGRLSATKACVALRRTMIKVRRIWRRISYHKIVLNTARTAVDVAICRTVSRLVLLRVIDR